MASTRTRSTCCVCPRICPPLHPLLLRAQKPPAAPLQKHQERQRQQTLRVQHRPPMAWRPQLSSRVAAQLQKTSAAHQQAKQVLQQQRQLLPSLRRPRGPQALLLLLPWGALVAVYLLPLRRPPKQTRRQRSKCRSRRSKCKRGRSKHRRRRSKRRRRRSKHCVSNSPLSWPSWRQPRRAWRMRAQRWVGSLPRCCAWRVRQRSPTRSWPWLQRSTRSWWRCVGRSVKPQTSPKVSEHTWASEGDRSQSAQLQAVTLLETNYLFWSVGAVISKNKQKDAME
mmetsp:Transcript_18881/g.52881  ORF Transcript_18881/g.52881 Transcript_18881/m.52881 type:complete len:281 (-) Transcript_18881:570-1412(-)